MSRSSRLGGKRSRGFRVIRLDLRMKVASTQSSSGIRISTQMTDVVPSRFSKAGEQGNNFQ